jgi:hypothetical protein
MLTWLSRLLSPARMKAENPDVRALHQLRSDLDKDPLQFPLSDLRPVLIPSPILATGNWVGPFRYFESLPVSLAWAFLRPNQTMMYLSTPTADALEARGVDWRAVARSAVVRDFDRHPWTHEYENDAGDVEAVAFLHEDGLGPSRLLCCNKLLTRFANGFVLFVPERSSALVLQEHASAKVRDSVHRAVRSCIEAAEVPMSAEPYSHHLLKTALERVGECA